MELLNVLPMELSKKVLGRMYFLKDEMHCAKLKTTTKKTILKILSVFIKIIHAIFIFYRLCLSLIKIL